MKLEFIKDAIYNGKIKYVKGSVHEVCNSLGEASRWLNRGIAKEIREKLQATEKVAEAVVYAAEAVVDEIIEHTLGPSSEEEIVIQEDSEEIKEDSPEEIASEVKRVENKRGRPKKH